MKPFFLEEIQTGLERRGVATASTAEAIRKLLKQAKTAKCFAAAEWLLEALQEFGVRALHVD